MNLAGRVSLASSLALLLGPVPLLAQKDLDQRIGQESDSLLATYEHLHENPELSTQENETSALIASGLCKLGYEVTDGFSSKPQVQKPDPFEPQSKPELQRRT